jgi:hypothetical protein
MDRSVDASAAKKTWVRCVDNGLSILSGDVALQQHQL